MGGEVPANPLHMPVSRESVATTGNYHSPQRVLSPSRATCNSRGEHPDRERWGDGEDDERVEMREKQSCNVRGEGQDGVDSARCKRKRR